MNGTQALTYIPNGAPINFNRLPRKMRESAAEQKYVAAVTMYSATGLTLRDVARACGVTAAGLSVHIGKHHRRLLFERYGLDPEKYSVRSLKVKPPKGQSLKTHLKYKDAIEAYGDIAYIEYNVSEIARMFGLSGTDLAFQLYVHYPDMIPDRERECGRLGISDKPTAGPGLQAWRPTGRLWRCTATPTLSYPKRPSGAWCRPAASCAFLLILRSFRVVDDICYIYEVQLTHRH